MGCKLDLKGKILLTMLIVCMPFMVTALDQLPTPTATSTSTPASTSTPTPTPTSSPISFNPQLIENSIQEKLPEATVGIVLKDAKTGQVLYERNASKAFAPASGLKVFTAAAVLKTLGPEYQFKTTVKIDKNSLKPLDAQKNSPKKSAAFSLKNALKQDKQTKPTKENKGTPSVANTKYTTPGNELTQNLIIEFSGDPSLDSESFKLLLKTALEMNNIKKISGKVVIDDTLFQAPHYPFGWSWNSLPWYFSAPITAVILNENRVKISIASNKNIGEKANITFANDEPIRLPMQSDVISVSADSAEKECSLLASMDEENRISLKGCWPKHDAPEALKLAVKNPALLAKSLTLEAFNEMNIEWSQEIIVGKAPVDAEILEEHHSIAVRELLKPMLQDSNNLYAESLFKTIGAKKSGTGTFLSGINATKEVLTKDFGLKESEFRIEDGSGGSRYTMVTPHQMSEVLYFMHQSPAFQPVLWEALPSWGESGTLKNREVSETKKALLGNVHAKTGSMNGVSSLSGYLQAKDGRDLIFVIMINNTLAKKGTLRAFEDELLTKWVSDTF